jgi:very-short-patch-repair endonuclease
MLKDLPEPLVNTKLNSEEADFHWPAHQIVVEIDGAGHERPRTRREDARKEAAWRAAGYTVLRIRDDELALSALRLQGLLQPRTWGPA